MKPLEVIIWNAFEKMISNLEEEIEATNEIQAADDIFHLRDLTVKGRSEHHRMRVKLNQYWERKGCKKK